MRWLRAEGRFDSEPQKFCEFGISEAIAGLVAGGLGGLGLGGGLIGTAAAPGLLATGIGGALEGAAGGALLGGITGGSPLTGALTGGLTGGLVGGFGPAIGSATGLGTTAGDIIAGTAGGAAGAGITGQNPIFGALGGAGTGAIAGFGSSAASGAATPTVASAPATGGGPSAVSTTAGVTPPAGALPMDLSSISPDAVSSFPAAPGATAFGLTPATTTNLLNAPAGGGGSAVSTGTTPLTPAAADAAASGGGGIANSILGFLGKNPGVVLGGGLLGADLLLGDQPLPAQKSLTTAAQQAGSTGTTLASYLFSGTLPPGAQQAVTNATNAAKAEVRSRYATMGLSGSTMEGQALQQVDQAAAAQTFAFADQLLKEGANYTQLSDQLYQTLLSTETTQQSDFGKALATFAAGLAGAKLGTTST